MSESLRALLANAVDYAGLYPPAGCTMADAVQSYATYRVSGDAWMLGRFVVAQARLAEFADAAAPYLTRAGEPWRLSVLVGDDVDADVAAIAALNASHGAVVCDALETRVVSVDDVARIARALRAAGVPAYVEVAAEPDPAAVITAINAQGLRAKIRTGGTTPGAFPSPPAVLRFLVACTRTRTPFKATAGLHHAVRGTYRLTYEAGAACGTMHGFLNVFVTAALLRDGAAEDVALDALTESDAHAFTFADDGVRWRGHLLLTARLAQLRALALGSFGSCSFTEPTEELAALALPVAPTP